MAIIMQTQTLSLHARVLRAIALLLLCVVVVTGYHAYCEYAESVRDREVFLSGAFHYLVEISLYADSWLEDLEGNESSPYSSYDIIFKLRELDMYCRGYKAFANSKSTVSGYGGFESFERIAERFYRAQNQRDIVLSKNLISALRDGSLQLLSELSANGDINMDNIYDRQDDCNVSLSTEKTNAIFKGFFVKLGQKDLLFDNSSFYYETGER